MPPAGRRAAHRRCWEVCMKGDMTDSASIDWLVMLHEHADSRAPQRSGIAQPTGGAAMSLVGGGAAGAPGQGGMCVLDALWAGSHVPMCVYVQKNAYVRRYVRRYACTYVSMYVCMCESTKLQYSSFRCSLSRCEQKQYSMYTCTETITLVVSSKLQQYA